MTLPSVQHCLGYGTPRTAAHHRCKLPARAQQLFCSPTTWFSCPDLPTTPRQLSWQLLAAGLRPRIPQEQPLVGRAACAGGGG